MSDIIIKAENLSKYYRLGQINNGMLFKDIQTWFARKLGKEDPHSQIGSVYEQNAEGFWALKDLNFEIKQGERVGIIGKNGAGKSTLLKILSQITAPTEGNLKIKGRIASLLEVGTGFHPEMTGRENIYLNGAILGMKKREIDKKLDEIIAFSEIEKHIDTPVKRYSSGMYVRLAFAIAAHLDSDILIADEVLAVGDAIFQKKALGKMNELSAGEGRTVLFVSHQMNAVKQLCNCGIVLDKGHIVLTSDIDSCISAYLSDSQGKELQSYNAYPDNIDTPFQVKSVYVLNQIDQNDETFESQTEIKIRINCISRKPIPGLYGYFSILNKNRDPIIIFDSNEQVESRMSDLQQGEYIWDIILPKGLLCPGTYIFYANFASCFNITGFNVDSPLDCCQFNVVDSLSSRGGNRGSVTSIIPTMRRIMD